jgi:hypothetical protein
MGAHASAESNGDCYITIIDHHQIVMTDSLRIVKILAIVEYVRSPPPDRAMGPLAMYQKNRMIRRLYSELLDNAQHVPVHQVLAKAPQHLQVVIGLITNHQ